MCDCVGICIVCGDVGGDMPGCMGMSEETCMDACDHKSRNGQDNIIRKVKIEKSKVAMSPM
jgi:hypothetical protein